MSKGMPKGHKSQSERASNGQMWNNFSNNINNVALDYNPKYEINKYEFV